MPDSLLPTPQQIADAKAACLQERTALRVMGIPVREDELELGLRLANAIWSAVHGVQAVSKKN